MHIRGSLERYRAIIKGQLDKKGLPTLFRSGDGAHPAVVVGEREIRTRPNFTDGIDSKISCSGIASLPKLRALGSLGTGDIIGAVALHSPINGGEGFIVNNGSVVRNQTLHGISSVEGVVTIWDVALILDAGELVEIEL